MTGGDIKWYTTESIMTPHSSIMELKVKSGVHAVIRMLTGPSPPRVEKKARQRNNVLRNRQYTADVNDIVRTLSNKEKKLLGASLHEDWIEKDYEYDTLTNIAKTFVTKKNNVPVSFIEIWTNGGNTGQIAIATRSGDEYRGKGYASKEVEKAIKWADRYGNKNVKELEWIAEKTNTGSNALAKKYGFKRTKTPNNSGWENYNRYVRKTKQK